jgi:enoyl-CoA hydratase/carnithine racemase
MLERTDTGAIAHLTMNAPDRLNALSDAMLAALQDALDRIATEPDIRAVILTGAGKAFCAGHDLNEMQVHGVAVAAGCQLVATCDMAVAADTTRFGVNGVNIGLFCSTPMVALTRVVPPKAAFEMLMTGRLIGAAEAATLGLINRAVAPENLETATAELAAAVAAKLGSAVRIGKRGFYDQIALDTAAAYALAGSRMAENMLNPDTDEGIAAFLAKRPPNWTQ